MVEFSAPGGVTVAVVSGKYCDHTSERHLTVRKTCLFYPGDGFAVYEHHSSQTTIEHQQEIGNEKVRREEENGVCGELVFRVDTYGGPELQKRRSPGPLVLMGPYGDCILTVKKKWPSLHQRWEGFLGGDDGRVNTATLEPLDGGAVGVQPSYTTPPSTKKPLFSVRRSSIIRGFGKGAAFLVDAYPMATSNAPTSPLAATDPGPTEQHYRIEGCYPHRCCAVYEDGDGEGGAALAEISRKVDATSGVVLGRDVFCLRLVPGFDAAFAMGLVLALDQICGDDADNVHDHVDADDLPGHSCRCNGGSSPSANSGGCSPNGCELPAGRSRVTDM